jgi:hypothetical protein
VRTEQHEGTLTNVTGQFYRHAAAVEDILVAGGGMMELVFPSTQQRVMRGPSTAFWPY